MTEPTLAIVALTHGAPAVENRAAILQLGDAVSVRLPDTNVEIHFVEARRPETELVAALGSRADTVVIVPFVLSAGAHLGGHLRELFATAVNRGTVRITDPIAPDERITQALVSRLAPLQVRQGDVLVVAAAGSSNPAALKECAVTARRVGSRLGVPVSVGYIAAGSPRISDAIAIARLLHPGARMVVCSYLLAPGTFNDAVRALDVDAISEPLLTPHTPADPVLVDVVVERYAEAISPEARAAS